MNKPQIEISAPPEHLLHHPDVAKTRALHSGTLFHGTGRLAKSNGKLVDVLKGVLESGLQPQVDHVARLILPVERTVSLTRQRIYARLYGEKFGVNNFGQNQLDYTFGNHDDWWRYFMEECKGRGKSLKNLPWLKVLHRNLKDRFTVDEQKHWKDGDFHKERWFAHKVAAEKNYPVVIGVDETAVQPLDLPHGLSDFEVRNADMISPEALKFIEVPLQRVVEVRELIDKLGVTKMDVLPIEIGEVVCWEKGLEKCAQGN